MKNLEDSCELCGRDWEAFWLWDDGKLWFLCLNHFKAVRFYEYLCIHVQISCTHLNLNSHLVMQEILADDAHQVIKGIGDRIG